MSEHRGLPQSERAVPSAARLSVRLQLWFWRRTPDSRPAIAARPDCAEALHEDILADPTLLRAWLSRQRADIAMLERASQVDDAAVTAALCHQVAAPSALVRRLAANAGGAGAWALLEREGLDDATRGLLASRLNRPPLPFPFPDAGSIAERVGGHPGSWVVALDRSDDPVLLSAAVKAFPDDHAVQHAVVNRLVASESHGSALNAPIRSHNPTHPYDTTDRTHRRIIERLLQSPTLRISDILRIMELRVGESLRATLDDRVLWVRNFEQWQQGCRVSHGIGVECARRLSGLLGDLTHARLFADLLAEPVCNHLASVGEAVAVDVLGSAGEETLVRLAREALLRGDSGALRVIGQQTTLGLVDTIVEEFPLPPLLAAVPVGALPPGFVARQARRIVYASSALGPLLGVPVLATAVLEEVGKLPDDHRETVFALLGEWGGDLPGLIAAARSLTAELP